MSATIKELNSINKALWKERFALIAKTIEVINVIGWNKEGKYTFEDGETWSRFDPDYDINTAQRKYAIDTVYGNKYTIDTKFNKTQESKTDE